jgi:uncharacterized membrane protein YkvA (DUF1232 family)
MTRTSTFGERIARGSVFRGLKNKAAEYLRNPDKLRQLVEKGRRKAESAGRSGPLKDVWDSLLALFRLLRAYAKREHTDIPWQSLVLIVAAVLYFLVPVDVIPDFILGLGYLDDAAIIAWVVKTLQSVLDDFRKWESTRAEAPGQLCD